MVTRVENLIPGKNKRSDSLRMGGKRKGEWLGPRCRATALKGLGYAMTGRRDFRAPARLVKSLEERNLIAK